MKKTTVKQRIGLSVFVLSVLVFATLSFFFSLQAAPPVAESPLAQIAFGHGHVVVQASTSGKKTRFAVEVARSKLQQARGLMFRSDVPKGTGMLFVFDEPKATAFWMKNTRVPLDLLFVRADGSIGHIVASAPPYDLTAIPSNGPVASVLEIGGGEAARLGIQVGDSLQYMAN